MQKKGLLLFITSSLSIGVISASILMNTANHSFLYTEANKEYTLTIDASNKSNFVQDGDVYRGTFKTGLGNDIVFKTKSAPSTKDGVALEMTSKNDYLINETPLRGVTRMDVTGHYLNDEGKLGTYYALYVYYLADLDMANLDKDSLTNSTNTIYSVEEYDHTYVVNSVSGVKEGNAYYYIGNKDYFYSDCTWVIDSVKYYFSCQSTRTYVSVTSSDSSLGEVNINDETYISSRYTVVANGTSVTIHAKKLDDFVDEKFVSFKGWRLNGSEEYVSTSEDYTFTTVQDGSYKFVADFDTAETELFDCGTKVPLATGYYHTYVYSDKVEKYYAIEGVSVGVSGEHTNQTLNTNELFVERHENVAFHSTSQSYFKLNRNPRDGWGTDTYITDDQYEKFDPTKVQAVIFYLAMDESDRIDELSSTNGTFTTYSNLQDPLDGNKAMSKVVWTGFTSDEANVYVPQTYRDADKNGTLWIKRMKVVYR